MKRAHILVLSLAVGLAAIAAVSAVGQTTSLGSHAHTTTDEQVASQTAQLNRYEASLRKALAQKPPALPPVPASGTTSSARQVPVSAATSAAGPTRIVYHRPPPIVVTAPGADDEHDGEYDGEHDRNHGEDHHGDHAGGDDDD